MILPVISLCEQTLAFEEDAIYGDASIPPYSVSYSVRYGEDKPFINHLIEQMNNLDKAFHLWDNTEFNVRTLIDISQKLVDTYPPPYEEGISIELDLFDGHDCSIASTVYDGYVLENPDYDYSISY